MIHLQLIPNTVLIYFENLFYIIWLCIGKTVRILKQAFTLISSRQFFWAYAVNANQLSSPRNACSVSTRSALLGDLPNQIAGQHY